MGASGGRGRNPMRDDDDDEVEKYREQIKGLAVAFRGAPHNMTEEIEKLGFTYVVGDNEGADEIIEERAARPQTDFQIALVSYLDGDSTPSEYLLELWREETRREDSPCPLWRRYFRTGNAQLRKLILHGLDQYPTSCDLLDNLSVLHSFVPIPKELLCRYTLACDLESDPRDSAS